MPRSAESLLAARRTGGRENRLTAIFAVVLDACDELTRALFEELDLPVAERFQVFTEERVTPGERPDMIVHSLSRAGAIEGRLWSEHKLDAGFGDLQRERYLAVLRSLPGEGQLIFIVRDAPASREAGDWRGFTWQEIGELAEGVGREWAGRDWRMHALAADAQAKWRLLYELLWYLEEEEDLAVVQALDDENLIAYKLMDDTSQALIALLERAAQHAVPLEPWGDFQTVDDITLWQQFDTPPGSWLERFGKFDCAAEILISDRDYWSPDELDEPAVAAGYSFERKLHASLSSRRDWVRELDAAGFCCELWNDHVCVYKTMPLREVLTFGETLNAQGRQLGVWTQVVISELGELDPGAVDLPVSSRRKRK
jgi:hypothetical protein